MKVVFILCLVGITAGFSLSGRQNDKNKLNADTKGQCKDTFSEVGCDNFKAKGWCDMEAIKTHCCATCTEKNDRKEFKDDELVRLLREYLSE